MTLVTFDNSLPCSCPRPFPFLSVMPSQCVMERAEYIFLVLRCHHTEFPSHVFLSAYKKMPLNILSPRTPMSSAGLLWRSSSPSLCSCLGLAQDRYSTLHSDLMFWAKTMHYNSHWKFYSKYMLGKTASSSIWGYSYASVYPDLGLRPHILHSQLHCNCTGKVPRFCNNLVEAKANSATAFFLL